MGARPQMGQVRMTALSTGVVGATGYLGGQLVQLLHGHPALDLDIATSTRLAGRPLSKAWPGLSGTVDLTLTAPEAAELADLEVVFVAAPADAAAALVPDVLGHGTGTRVVDLSGAHRLRDPALHAATYPDAARDEDLAATAVYGLPEVAAETLAGADLVANPGCYPTGAALAVLPLVREGLVGRLYVSSVSGISGAGRGPSDRHHFPEANESVSAYGVGVHRHQPEIQQALGLVGAAPDEPQPTIPVTFVPHVAPMDRGIETTVFVPLANGGADAAPDTDLDQALLTALYEKAFAEAAFVRVVDAPPRTKDVRGTNLLHVHPTLTPDGATVVVNAAHDNLLKGGAGQAVQNANLMAGLDEGAGLPLLGGGT